MSFLVSWKADLGERPMAVGEKALFGTTPKLSVFAVPSVLSSPLSACFGGPPPSAPAGAPAASGAGGPAGRSGCSAVFCGR